MLPSPGLPVFTALPPIPADAKVPYRQQTSVARAMLEAACSLQPAAAKVAKALESAAATAAPAFVNSIRALMKDMAEAAGWEPLRKRAAALRSHLERARQDGSADAAFMGQWKVLQAMLAVDAAEALPTAATPTVNRLWDLLSMAEARDAQGAQAGGAGLGVARCRREGRSAPAEQVPFSFLKGLWSPCCLLHVCPATCSWCGV